MMCAILGRKRPSRRGTVDVISDDVPRDHVVIQYHLRVPSLFCSIDEGFRDRFTPVDACAEDIEEEGFELVRFGHDGSCGARGKGKLSLM